jgi:uncharacterized protein
MRKPLVLLSPILFAATLWSAGCARTQSAHFYTLSPLALQEAQPPTRPRPVSIRLEPVEVPDYLERPQLVTRTSQQELKLSEYHRWGGSLAANLTSVLAENLALLTGSEHVLVPPLPRGEKPDYTVVLRVLRLDCQPGDQVLLKAQWFVLARGERAEMATHLASFSEPLPGASYKSMVAAVSRALAQLNRAIAREILDLAKVVPTAASGR